MIVFEALISEAMVQNSILARINEKEDLKNPLISS